MFGAGLLKRSEDLAGRDRLGVAEDGPMYPQKLSGVCRRKRP